MWEGEGKGKKPNCMQENTPSNHPPLLSRGRHRLLHAGPPQLCYRP